MPLAVICPNGRSRGPRCASAAAQGPGLWRYDVRRHDGEHPLAAAPLKPVAVEYGMIKYPGGRVGSYTTDPGAQNYRQIRCRRQKCRTENRPKKNISRRLYPQRTRKRSAQRPSFLFVSVIAFCRVTDYVDEAAVDRHLAVVVFDKAKLPELVHEKIDP